MTFDNSENHLQIGNVPIQPDGIVPKDDLAHWFMYRKRISKKKIEELAIQKDRKCGKGIDFSDVMELGCSKTKAQRILKDCCQRRMGKDGTLHAPILFRSPKRTSPQQYYPSSLRADIFERLKQRGNVPIYPTELSSSKAPLSTALEQQKAQNLLDILFSLGSFPLYIHKVQLQLTFESRYYNDIQKSCSQYNKSKQHEEEIGSAVVKYLVYPNGKVMVFVACSNSPFKLEDEADTSILYSFLGQARDRMLYLVSDPQERIVPPITEWRLVGCDMNKDIAVTDMLQLTAINLQLKDADRVFRVYIKSLGDKAVYRVEESQHPHKPAIQVINDVLNPVERIGEKIDKQQDKITEIHSMVSRITDSLRVPPRVNATAITEQNNNTSSQLGEGG
jgi:hypothetical protein